MKFTNKFEQLQSYEKQFADNNYNGLKSDKAYTITEGNLPIMISAPHAVNHYRHQEIKQADTYTGGLALLLKDNLNVSAICKTYNDMNDINYDIDTLYEKDLSEYIKNKQIKCLIDLHIAAENREFDIEVGDADYNHIKYQEYLYPMIKGILLEKGLHVDHNQLFKASYEGTVSSEIHNHCQIPTFQLEINCQLFNDEASFNKLYEALEEIIKLFIKLF